MRISEREEVPEDMMTDCGVEYVEGKGYEGL